MWDYEHLFKIIAELVMHHSPSGVEAEINQFLLQEFAKLGVEVWSDRADNVIAKIPGKNPDRAIAITAHKDEIGAIVKTIGDHGRVEVRKLGGSYPWIYGEGVVDLLGDAETISGILSFGSRHVSHESPQKVQQEDTSIKWENAWIETKCTTAELEAAGIRPGTRMVVGKHRKHPIRLKDHIASYTLDNKASVAILLALAQQLKQPAVDVYLVASAKEEVGAIGALFFTQNQVLDALIALEICPLSSEYPIEDGKSPVILSQDAYGIYDEALNGQLCHCAKQIEIPVQLTILSQFGSDASIAMKFGHVGRAACLAFPTQNTHGYEIAHLGAIANCISLLQNFCENYPA
ncbi:MULTISPECIES: M42 family metallopeptidase [unclassified Tolypothrix]|uniref:M42 family metallopeptidase n=1 Tax=unclassified Tolypothrix TaxID=2649714 RepID=UPI0005EAB53C|nr:MULTISPECIES: M42 family peptidase [unclassified Tolypothrix]BAY91651.1 peptidase M42 family protein [Microchaete diplosiphon NIES-3275]EKF05234.1 M42 glutamyl aminopeptidase [Tolypothrix sp. PCC 7601]MBE9083309.1 M42 family peptidase [Tolypothrix sp. LEGE 11397]UYD25668.1 M42 family peptidase [Tolypothrix sp. PCC 7712]UYD32091.1 M42 family peptidase [Tolypothrix sp. PCC 7601]